MSDYVSSQKTIELTFDSDIEVISSDLEKLQFTSSGEVLMSRPDKLRAHRVGGYADVELYFNGKQVSIFGKNLDGYAQFDATGTLDQLFEALRSGHGVALPGADLLLSNPYDVLVAGVIEANNIGRGVIDGVECEHLAFRNFDTDWQLWVQRGRQAHTPQVGDHQQNGRRCAPVHASRQELEDRRHAGLRSVHLHSAGRGGRSSALKR